MTSTAQIRVVVNLDVEPDRAESVATRCAGALCTALGRTVDVHGRRLRTKIGVCIPLLTTVRGVGYCVDNSNLYLLSDVVDFDVARAG